MFQDKLLLLIWYLSGNEFFKKTKPYIQHEMNKTKEKNTYNEKNGEKKKRTSKSLQSYPNATTTTTTTTTSTVAPPTKAIYHLGGSFSIFYSSLPQINQKWPLHPLKRKGR